VPAFIATCFTTPHDTPKIARDRLNDSAVEFSSIEYDPHLSTANHTTTTPAEALPDKETDYEAPKSKNLCRDRSHHAEW
jgi:hypothetical protein